MKKSGRRMTLKSKIKGYRALDALPRGDEDVFKDEGLQMGLWEGEGYCRQDFHQNFEKNIQHDRSEAVYNTADHRTLFSGYRRLELTLQTSV